MRLPAGSTIKAIGHYDNSARNRSNPVPEKPVYWSERSADKMFNGWLELSVDRHVIAHRAVNTLATPINRRVSVSLGGGPAGTVVVRDASGQLVTTGATDDRRRAFVHRTVDVHAGPDDHQRRRPAAKAAPSR